MNMRTCAYRLLIVVLCFFSISQTVSAETINAFKLVQHAEVTVSPASGSFVEGTTFDVPLLLNTKGANINGIEVHLTFDKDKLSIIQPSGGTSIIGVWVQPPVYDNTRGTASYVGVVPNGIKTSSGLIGMITFKAKATGSAKVVVDANSKVLLNDGLGTEATLDTGRATYVILPKAPEGAKIYSETHPLQDTWYNNNNPVISWEREEGVQGYSYILDNKPATVPENTIISNDNSTGFTKLSDGLWYFHIKAMKKGVWGSASHFLVRIDTAPPAEFTPETNYLIASIGLVNRTLVSFFTTDNLSGVDHYEVGVIDKSQPTTVSPAFVESQSPFQVPSVEGKSFQVIVRAIDKAGNVRDESVDVKPRFVITQYVKEYLVYILAGIILLGIILLLLHYLFGHHIIRNLQRFRAMLRREEEGGGPPTLPRV